jgi:serine/threonine-protein kinase
MTQEAQSLREDLYRVVHHYAELSELAQKGEVDPIGEIGRILRNRLPYLLLVIRDMLPALERDTMTYFEVLFHIMRAAQKFPDQKVLIQSRQEIEKIESGAGIFSYAVKWIRSEEQLRPSPKAVEQIRRTLALLNTKYRERYAPDDDDTASLIPHFLSEDEGESEEARILRVADLVRRAVLELFRLTLENRPSRWASLFGRRSDKELESDLMMLVRFLFRCGFPVDRIASGYYRDAVSDFLHEKLLDSLIEGAKNIDSLHGVSSHLAVISVMDFGSFFELVSDYRDLGDPKEIAKHVKQMKARNRRGATLLKKVSDLHTLYGVKASGRLAREFLAYRYHSAFGDYHGIRRQPDPRGGRAVELYKPVVDREAMEKRTRDDLRESGRFFSSKTRDEMASLIRLIMDSLENPDKVKGTKVKVLGDISSGAMGKVSIGIFRGKIVALKTVRSQMSEAFGDPVALLHYEATMHSRVQSPEQHPYIVDYYGLVEQAGDKLLINSYHPNDNLTQLVEKNWTAKFKPPLSTQSFLSLATLEVVINQLLDCLTRFRERGVVHRDLKTDNVLYMVDENENVNRIKVIDFGVSLAAGADPIDDVFQGKVVGTFSYMAPEQVKGRSCFASDLYSVGAIMTVMLTGKLPMVFPKVVNRQDLAKQIARVESEPRPKLTTLNPRLRKDRVLLELAEVTASLLNLDPVARPSIEEARQEFKRVFDRGERNKSSVSVFYHRG